MATFSPSPAPTYGPANRQYAPRILQTQFGDGYRQRAADGINSLGEEYAIGWANITTAEKDAISAFFVARGAWDAFDYTIPGDTVVTKWTCKSWTEIPKTPGYWDLTASFRREFDI